MGDVLYTDLPPNLADIMAKYGVRPEGTTLESWYITDEERIAAIGRAEAERSYGGPPSTWDSSPPIPVPEPVIDTPTVTPIDLSGGQVLVTPGQDVIEVSNNGGVEMGVPYTTEWDEYDIKAAAAGKNGFLGPSDFWKLSDWGLYASAVEDQVGWTWDGKSYQPPGGGNGGNGGDEGMIGLLLAGAAFLLMG